MIAGYESRQLVVAQIEALEREKSAGKMNEGRLAEIEKQQQLFQSELESLGEDGDYPQPEAHPAAGTSAFVGRQGRGLLIA